MNGRRSCKFEERTPRALEREPGTLIRFYLTGHWIHSDLSLTDVEIWLKENAIEYRVTCVDADRGHKPSFLDLNYPSCVLIPDEDNALLCHLRFV